ncbi:MAG: hypothetical protein OXF27_20485 [Acidobacteria bacterium]|nr:hypothetical protein [Acidobacteriota bacterium]
MLSAAAIGMLIYGLHDIVAGTADLFGGTVPEWWAAAWRILAGASLALAALFVRASVPGGLALAVAGLLGLQSISLHNDPHIYGDLLLWPQVSRAVFSAALVALAWLGWNSSEDAAAGSDDLTERGTDGRP